jgi:hypothetical protein
MFLGIILFVINIFSHVFILDSKLSAKSNSLIKKNINLLTTKKIEPFPFIENYLCIKINDNSYLINVTAYEPICFIKIHNQESKVCTIGSRIVPAEFYSQHCLDNLPVVMAQQDDHKFNLLGSWPTACFSDYQIDWQTAEKIFLKNQSGMVIITTANKPITFEIEKIIQDLKFKNKIPAKAILDIRYADQIILKGDKGNGKSF